MNAPHQPSAWRRQLLDRDREIHAEIDADAHARESAALRVRNAELAAALTQARGGIQVRDSIISSLGARVEELEGLVARRGEEARGARAELDAVVGSARWRAGGAASTVLRAPVRLLRSVRRG